MKKISKFTYIALSLLPVISMAQENPGYNFLVPLPGITSNANISTYIPAMFNLAMGVGAALAVIMITYGGILYATTDAIGNKERGKDYIQDALWGLLILLGSYAILNTINPAMLRFDLNMTRPQIQTATSTVVAGTSNVGGNIAGVPMTQEQLSADAMVRSMFGPRLSAIGPCRQGQTTGCVNLNGLRTGIISDLNYLANACNCDIRITGGTEAGHSVNSSHNTGSAVDIGANSSLTRVLVTDTRRTLEACGVYSFGTGRFLWEPRGSTCGGTVPSSNDHWHVSY